MVAAALQVIVVKLLHSWVKYSWSSVQPQKPRIIFPLPPEITSYTVQYNSGTHFEEPILAVFQRWPLLEGAQAVHWVHSTWPLDHGWPFLRGGHR